MEAALTPGDEFRVADLDTRAGTVRVGLMICYDREFPESARVLMLGGTELILTPNACGLDADRLGQFRARAYENIVGVAMANYATPDPAADLGHLGPPDVCNGHSVAFSGIRFDREGNGLDHKLVEAGEGEELVLADSTSRPCAPTAPMRPRATRTASRRRTRRSPMTPRCRCSSERTVAGRSAGGVRTEPRPRADQRVRKGSSGRVTRERAVASAGSTVQSGWPGIGGVVVP
jgi:predicted amidohydrolase